MPFAELIIAESKCEFQGLINKAINAPNLAVMILAAL